MIYSIYNNLNIKAYSIISNDLFIHYINQNIVTLEKIQYVHFFLKGISEDLIESLNLMAAGDISHKNFAHMGEMCKNYSRSRGKVAKKFKSVLVEM